MFIITDNNIKITRGDTGRTAVDILDSLGKVFLPAAEDTMIFTVKKTIHDTTPLIQTTITNSLLEILPEETEELEFGRYVYDVEITLANGDVNTIIPCHSFEVTEEVS